MKTSQELADYKRAFVEACAQVLGKIPDESLFRPHTNSNGQQTITWNSYNKGMIGLMTERRYQDKFGDEPEWLAGCHLHHQHLLRQLASQWDVSLPAEKPATIDSSPESARDYRTPSPPCPPQKTPPAATRSDEAIPEPISPPQRPTKQPWKATIPGTVELEQALAQLARSTHLRKLIRDEFGENRAKAMFAMMRKNSFVGDEGNELHDFLLDGIGNDSVTVWETVHTSLYYDEEVDWPIHVERFHGVFQVWSPEHDHVGLFLDLEDAKAYVYANWENAK